MSCLLRLHNILTSSEVNGPGKRFVVWTQGCPLKCKGCFNQASHDDKLGFDMEVAELAEQINQTQDIRGVTLTGGEPLAQAEAVGCLLDLLDKKLDVLLFSGYSFEEVSGDSVKKQILQKIDAGLFGRYNQKLSHPFCGKKLVLRGNRILKEEVKPWLKTELTIDDNSILLTGIYKKGGNK